MTKKIKRVIKSLLRLPADALVSSSRVFDERVAASSGVLENPFVGAKAYPYERNGQSYILPKPVADDHMYDPGLPLPPKELWEGYGAIPEHYLSSGRQGVRIMRDILAASGFRFETGSRVLDFGCASGRMMRWFKDLSEQCELWGADIGAPNISWCQRYLSPPFRFVTTTTFPHLPFEDRYFDLIYAGSVFTHIADLADTWLLELKRILRVGGKLYITIHDQHSIDVLLNKHPDNWLTRSIVSFDKDHPFMKDFAVAVMWSTPKAAQVFYDREYLRRSLERHFRVLSIHPDSYGVPLFQTAVLLEK
jgi:ubiquinone/menaquinone biosynthesis C-methylase UbiE